MESDRGPKKASVWPLVALMGAVILVWAGAGYILFHQKDRGELGDMFGVVNALFSGLAFAGIIYTIFLQRQELEFQRRELADTREVLEGQKIQLARQAFENAFFQMVSLHNEIVVSLRYLPRRAAPGGEKRGRDCFASLTHDLHESLNSFSGLMETRYEAFYEADAHKVLGHYFRNLYQIVKYVANSDVADKKFYTNIVRAQLSTEELILLFWNTFSKFGTEKFKPLILEFEFLEHLPLDRMIQGADAFRYGKKAFGKNAEWAKLFQAIPQISPGTLKR